MTEIIDTPGEYVVSRNGVVIACAVPTPAGESLGATTNPSTIQRHQTRDLAVQAIRRAVRWDA